MTKETLQKIIELSYTVENSLRNLKDICNSVECGEKCPIYCINGNNKHNPYLSCPVPLITNKETLETRGEKYRYKQINTKNRC